MLKACIVCFNKNAKLFHLDNVSQLRYNYNTVSGLQTYPNNGMPTYLCAECCCYVQNSIKFRQRCQRSHVALQEILHRKMVINHTDIEALRHNEPHLSYLDPKRMHYEEIEHNISKIDTTTKTLIDIPTIHYSIDRKESELNIKMEYDKSWVSIDKDNKDDDTFEYESSKYSNGSSDSAERESPSIDNDDVKKEDTLHINTLKVQKEPRDQLPDVKAKKSKNLKKECMSLVEEYANLESLTITEAKAAMEIKLQFCTGKNSCKVCGKAYVSEKCLKEHVRMHEKHISGTFLCELCKKFYKTDNLLKSHMTEKHLYKYICRKCPDVNFDRVSAKRHFFNAHYKTSQKSKSDRPHWLSNRGVKRKEKHPGNSIKRKKKKLPDDYLLTTPMSQAEQYKMVLDRKESRNYIEADYRCELCYRGFKFLVTYNNHMKRHDPAISGKLQCDMCKMQFKNTLQIYKHMVSMHTCKYECQVCGFVTPHGYHAQMHYRWHKNEIYKCPYCEKEFKKMSTRGTHIRIHHPSTNICSLCGHSFISKAGLDGHKRLTHSKEDLDKSTSLTVDINDPLYCADCKIQFVSKTAFDTHLGSSNKHAATNVSVKGRKKTRSKGDRNSEGTRKPVSCDIKAEHGEALVNNSLSSNYNLRFVDQKDLLNETDASVGVKKVKGVRKPMWCNICRKHMVCNEKEMREHHKVEHPKPRSSEKKYMCDICGHTTKELSNLQIHRRTHTKEKPYSCPHCDRRFSAVSSRNAHLVVHTGEKPYQCPQCERRFTQKYSVKLHIQTVHLKIPYPPWDKKRRRQRQQDAIDSVDCLL